MRRSLDKLQRLGVLIFVVIAVFFVAGVAFSLPYPFSDDMEDTLSGNWVFDSPWGYDMTYAHGGVR